MSPESIDEMLESKITLFIFLVFQVCIVDEASQCVEVSCPSFTLAFLTDHVLIAARSIDTS